MVEIDPNCKLFLCQQNQKKKKRENVYDDDPAKYSMAILHIGLVDDIENVFTFAGQRLNSVALSGIYWVEKDRFYLNIRILDTQDIV